MTETSNQSGTEEKRVGNERRRGKDDNARMRLSKRLSYILRYGAEKEGLRVGDTGYIDLKELMTLPLLQTHTEKEVLDEIKVSRSDRGHKRYEFKRQYDGQVLVRALYGRKMERSPYHEGCKVIRLMETCLIYICQHIEEFDLMDCPDEYLLSCVVHKLKRQKKLTNNAMKCALGTSLENLDLDGVYLTEKSLKIITARCPNLKFLNLKNCGYLLNDQIFTQMIKKLPHMEKINLAFCTQLSGKSLKALQKYVPTIVGVNVACIPNFTQADILDFISKCQCLIYINFIESGLEMTDDFCLKLTDLWTVWKNPLCQLMPEDILMSPNA
ncbi:uncharacterized protein LOC144435285 [Glandiceps talaboti]